MIEKAKQKFFQMIDDFGFDPYHLRPHVPEAEKWVKHLLKKYPEADAEVVILAVWLHDIGHYPVPTEIDHAVRGEERAREFLEKFNYPKMEKVLHCIRAHRCKDVLPNTIEAKIIACADSASHMTDSIYFDIAKNDKENNQEFRAYAKMERDFRDLFPEIQEELAEILDAWKRLIQAYEKL
ncbi:MAG: HD domain-containing protein [Candidatus Woesearchaeota archaeon]